MKSPVSHHPAASLKLREPAPIADVEERLQPVYNPMDRASLALSISLPLRPEEVLSLKWKDVDTESCVVHVRNTVIHLSRNKPEFKPYTKTASSVRDLVLSKEILSFLPERGESEEFVIGGEKPVSYTQLRGIRKRVNWAPALAKSSRQSASERRSRRIFRR